MPSRAEVLKTIAECFPSLPRDQQDQLADVTMKKLEGQPKYPRKDLIKEVLK